jgi:hypothetical protein
MKKTALARISVAPAGKKDPLQTFQKPLHEKKLPLQRFEDPCKRGS